MEPLGPLKILSYRELKLVNENLFEGIQIILLIEYKHGLLVVNRIYRAKTQRTITIGYQYGIAGEVTGVTHGLTNLEFIIQRWSGL